MKAIALMSGGKDSFLSAYLAMQQGFDIVKAVIVRPQEYSYMFHFPNVDMAGYVAGLLDLDHEFVSEDMFQERVFHYARDGVRAMISGAIASEFQKTRLERMATEASMISYTPLWKIEQHRVIREILDAGIRAMIVSVSADGFGEEDLGREIDVRYLNHLRHIESRYGINITGEGGEYETFVFGFGKKQLNVHGHRVWKGSGGYFTIDSID
ncbi:diphthine--ammonia ligase [Thermoplasma sp.]|uniref:diphthine--ammonia ligase n=1 Tax=Thermoplasma sp. TaxID=1973142 RepID=UPI001274909C|nr:diphthine--ammonia ligase [Thermoplasma sp.]KAA8923397.1 MAG: diphthine--ammonia ligase [Thermoplasma sp.]